MTTPHDGNTARQSAAHLDESPALTAQQQNRLVSPAVQAPPELVAEIAQLVKENTEARKRAAAQLNAFIANQEKINEAQAATNAAQSETNAQAAAGLKVLFICWVIHQIKVR